MIRLRRLFLAPAVGFLMAFFAIPLGIIFIYSVLTRGAYGGVAGTLTFENYARMFDPLYAKVLLRTFVTAGEATGLCLLLGFPLALFISRAGSRKNLYLQLVVLP